MPFYRQIISYDASAINRLVDDPDSPALCTLLTHHYYSRITSTNLEEISANQSTARRHQLLEYVNPLVVSGECIEPPHWIIERLAQEYARGESFDWRKVHVRFYNAEDAAFRNKIATDKLAVQQLREMKRLDATFCSFFDAERPKYEEFFNSGLEARPGKFQQLVDRFMMEDGAFWGLSEVIYHGATKTTPDRQLLVKFVDACPPFRAFILAVLIAQFERSGIRDLKVAPSFRAGRFDLFSAIYLCYCDLFISADRRQHNALREIAIVGKLRARVTMYKEFRRRLFPFSSFTTRSLGC